MRPAARRTAWRGWASAALLLTALAALPAAAQAPPASAGPVTVVVDVVLAPNSTADEALVALRDLRTMMRRQPGYLADDLLRNINPDTPPRFLHVSRWASMTYWALLFQSAEFGALQAHGNAHYTLSASAFLAAE
jgi:heme-degrading monooxygenase HmoA